MTKILDSPSEQQDAFLTAGLWKNRVGYSEAHVNLPAQIGLGNLWS